MLIRVTLCLLAAHATVPRAAGADISPVSEARGTLARLVETRQMIAKTKADWLADKETLEQSIRLFDRELAEVQEHSAKVETGGGQMEKERADALAEKEALMAASTISKEQAAKLEEQVRKLLKLLPSPLLAKVDPLVKRLPDISSETKFSVAERFQTLVGILSEVDKFNGSVTIASEIKRVAGGDELQLNILYLGLAQAYAVDKPGKLAFVGTPGPDGWQWTPKEGIASTVKGAIAMHDNSQPAAFVKLPVEIR